MQRRWRVASCGCLLLPILLMASGCSTSGIIPNATVAQVASLVRTKSHELMSVGPDFTSWHWTEEVGTERVVFSGSTSSMLDVLPAILFLGQWVICDGHVTLALEQRGPDVEVSLRWLSHHQVLMVFPVVFGHGDWEQASSRAYDTAS